MNYKILSEYLLRQMRMSHVYQPVMIKRLLLGKGKAKDIEIAFDLIRMDDSQLEYYRERVNQMVGKILQKNGVVIKEKQYYLLKGFDNLTPEQVEELILICDNKISDYQMKRGEAIWAHRNNQRIPVSGSIRYEVLKRAHGRCELCGISMEERALEVDHIIPKNLRGDDDISNYQALCYKCNANKRDTDSTDFRGMSIVYDHKEDYCLFCSPEKSRVIAENRLAYVIKDNHPVTKEHCLIIPKRHFASYLEIKQPELNSVQQLIQQGSLEAMNADKSISGFNIGVNQGVVAGQTIMHCHIHLIPRREGDMVDPRGGVRHCVEGKGYY